MNIYITENIRRLRREREITQEKLADHLGVTMQAVSKWERGDSIPDISMVIPLAAYFGVTTDELLGFDAARNEARILDYLRRIKEARAYGSDDRATHIAIEAYKEFPNDFRIINRYVRYIDNFQYVLPGYTKTREDTKDEVIRLCTYVLDECTDPDERSRAAQNLIHLYIMLGGMRDEAAALCGQFPERYRNTRGEMLEQVYSNDPGSNEECMEQYHKNIMDMIDLVSWKIFAAGSHNNRLSGGPGSLRAEDDAFEHFVKPAEKEIAFYELIFEDGDYGEFNIPLAILHGDLAARHLAVTGEVDKALYHIEKMLECDKANQEFYWTDEPYVHTSLLLRGHKVVREPGNYVTMPDPERAEELKTDTEWTSRWEWFEEEYEKYLPRDGEARERLDAMVAKYNAGLKRGGGGSYNSL